MSNKYDPFAVGMQHTVKTIDNSSEYNNLIDELSADEIAIAKKFTHEKFVDDLFVDDDFMNELSMDEAPTTAKLSLADAHIEAQSIEEPSIAVIEKPKTVTLSLADAHIEAQPLVEAIITAAEKPKTTTLSLAEAHIEAQAMTEPVIAAAENSKVVSEPPLLSRITQAYQSLQSQLADRQQRIQGNRNEIAALRSKIRALAAYSQPADKDEDELHNFKMLVQNDSCKALISHAEQIRDSSYDNHDHALSLLTPLKASVELLELRLKYVRALHQLLENMKAHMAIEERLLDIDIVIESLAGKLDISIAQ